MSFPVLSGVPQGSHLGPLLFNAFINDIGSCFRSTKFYMFADDLKFFRKVNSSLDSELLQRDLDSLFGWCSANGMSLNISKCYVIRFTRKRRSFSRTYHINGAPLSEVDSIRDLGVTIDSKLQFSTHIQNITRKSFKTLGFIFRNCKDFKKPHTKITIYNALV